MDEINYEQNGERDLASLLEQKEYLLPIPRND